MWNLFDLIIVTRLIRKDLDDLRVDVFHACSAAQIGSLRRRETHC